jgi:hypothetical protein
MISKAILEDCFGDFGRLNCYFEWYSEEEGAGECWGFGEI